MFNKIISSSLSICSIAFIACEESGSKSSEISFGSCKSSTEIFSSLKSSLSPSTAYETESIQECIRLSYSAELHTLAVSHVNALQNCCPDSMSYDIETGDGVMVIAESEHFDGEKCKCNCLMDLSYTVKDVSPGGYTVTVGSSWEADEYKNHFNVDLSSNFSGSFCDDRSDYYFHYIDQ